MRRAIAAGFIAVLLLLGGCSKPFWNTCKVSKIACQKTSQAR